MPHPSDATPAAPTADEGKALSKTARRLGRTARQVGKIGGGGGVTIDSLGRRWNSDLHPRDSLGRFVETGGIARAHGIGAAKVTRALGGGYVQVEDRAGKRHRILAARITMLKRPDGSSPTDDENAVLREDERRAKTAGRGDGVEADDIIDHDLDGIPDEDDHDDDGDGVPDSLDNDKAPKAKTDDEDEPKAERRFKTAKEALAHLAEGGDDPKHADAAKKLAAELTGATLSERGNFLIAKKGKSYAAIHAGTGKLVGPGYQKRAFAAEIAQALEDATDNGRPFDWSTDGLIERMARNSEALRTARYDAEKRVNDGTDAASTKKKTNAAAKASRPNDAVPVPDSPYGSTAGLRAHYQNRVTAGDPNSKFLTEAADDDTLQLLAGGVAIRQRKSNDFQVFHAETGMSFGTNLGHAPSRAQAVKLAARLADAYDLHSPNIGERMKRDGRTAGRALLAAQAQFDRDHGRKTMATALDDNAKAKSGGPDGDPNNPLFDKDGNFKQIKGSGAPEVDVDAARARRDQTVAARAATTPTPTATAATPDEYGVKKRTDGKWAVMRKRDGQWTVVSSHDKRHEAYKEADDLQKQAAAAPRRVRATPASTPDAANPNRSQDDTGQREQDAAERERQVAEREKEVAERERAANEKATEQLAQVTGQPVPQAGQGRDADRQAERDTAERHADAGLRADTDSDREQNRPAPSSQARTVEDEPKETDREQQDVRAAGADVLADVPAERAGGSDRPDGALPAARGRDRAADRGADRGADPADAQRGAGRDAGAERSQIDSDRAGDSRAAVDREGARDRTQGEPELPGAGAAPGAGNRPADRVAPGRDGGQRFRPASQADLAPSTKAGRLAGNLQALRALRTLQSERRPATEDEQRTLARWAGWGNLKDVFDEGVDKYAAERAELKDLLGAEEYIEARKNSRNAHYTDAKMVQPMWAALRQLGFGGGRVLEPGSGSGNFIGQAPDDARMTGVERDPITAGISAYLYPDANIRPESFGDTGIDDGAFDAAIGNVPFGQYPVFDRKHNRDGHNIHNHFILKSLALTKPGGTVAVITSRYTMDGTKPKSRKAREQMFAQADLVGAVRMPEGAHRAAAGTDVVTDLLIFRKRKDGETPGDDSWLQTEDLTVDGNTVPVNSYFRQHPDRVLGDLTVVVGGQYGPAPELAVHGDPNVGPRLTEALDRITDAARARGLRHNPDSDADADDDAVVLGDNTSLPEGRIEHVGSREVVDGKGKKTVEHEFSIVDDGEVVPYTVPSTQQDELAQLLRLRDLSDLLFRRQAESPGTEDTPELAGLRKRTRTAYARYVKDYGPIGRYGHGKTKDADEPGADGAPAAPARRVFPPRGGITKDPTADVLYGLEGDYDPNSKRAEPAAVLTTRTVGETPPLRKAAGGQDAMELSLERYGRIRLDEVAFMLDTDQTGAERALAGVAYLDPELDEFVPASDFLSGNVRSKLRAVEALAKTDPKWASSADALRTVVPADLDAADIDVKLGAPWVDEDLFRQFAAEVTGNHAVEVENPYGTRWFVKVGRGGYRSKILEEQTWGTQRKSVYDLLEDLLNQRAIKVTDTVEGPDGKKKRVFNEKATLAARDKADELVEKFKDWAWEDRQRADLLQNTYNETFRSHALRSYKNSPKRKYPGMAVGKALRPHQNDAVTRMVSEETVLLDHVVGSGKTFTMVAGLQELKRLGMVRKPAIVVPNHLLEQFAREYRELYPGANVIAADSARIGSGKQRRRFTARVAGGDWDAVILTQEALEKLPVSAPAMERYMLRQMATLREQLDWQREQDKGKGKKSRSTAQIEERIEAFETKLKTLLDKAKDDEGATFEETGIDYLAVDEAHHYKNLATVSSIEGAGIAGSGRAQDMDMKLSVLRESAPTDGTARVATFATGTPIANSVTESHVMMRYLRPREMEQAGLLEFDRWAATFGQVEEAVEASVDGNSFKVKSRFAAFTNVGELLRQWRGLVDSQTADMLNLPRPKASMEVVEIEPTRLQRRLIKSLGRRADAISSGQVTPDEDNLLVVASDGRKAALDMRLLGDKALHEANVGRYELEAEAAGAKLSQAASNIARIYSENADRKFKVRRPDGNEDPDSVPDHATPGALQFVFMDLGTPAAKGKKKNAVDALNESATGFTSYDDLKAKLIAQGIPASKIRFIHEADNPQKKADLFEAAKHGDIAVLIGSTQKMGTGVNAQNRAVALHHIDVPWRPADLEQRDGRVVRQGNQFDDVRVLRYVTKGTFDAFSWQTIARKANFIGQIQTGSLDTRVMEDLGDAAADAAQIKAIASGNPLLLDQAMLRQQLKKLRGRKAAAERAAGVARRVLRDGAIELTAREKDQQTVAEAISRRIDTTGDAFSWAAFDRYGRGEGRKFTDRKDAGENVVGSLRRMLRLDDSYGYVYPGESSWEQIGTLGGQPIIARTVSMQGSKPFAEVALGVEGQYGRMNQLPFQKALQVLPSQLTEQGAPGIIQSVESRLRGMDEVPGRIDERMRKLRTEMNAAEGEAKREFKQSDELNAAVAQQMLLDALLKQHESNTDDDDDEDPDFLDDDEDEQPAQSAFALSDEQVDAQEAAHPDLSYAEVASRLVPSYDDEGKPEFAEDKPSTDELWVAYRRAQTANDDLSGSKGRTPHQRSNDGTIVILPQSRDAEDFDLVDQAREVAFAEPTTPEAPAADRNIPDPDVPAVPDEDRELAEPTGRTPDAGPAGADVPLDVLDAAAPVREDDPNIIDDWLREDEKIDLNPADVRAELAEAGIDAPNLPEPAPALTTTDYDGEYGNTQHITRIQQGTIPTSAVANMPGVKGEVPGEHRARQGEQWQAFLDDIRTNGITSPLFITVDPGQPPRLSEGNHRRDAAIELGLTNVPVNIRYFGHAERDTQVIPDAPDARTTMDTPAPERAPDAPGAAPKRAPEPDADAPITLTQDEVREALADAGVTLPEPAPATQERTEREQAEVTARMDEALGDFAEAAELRADGDDAGADAIIDRIVERAIDEQTDVLPPANNSPAVPIDGLRRISDPDDVNTWGGTVAAGAPPVYRNIGHWAELAGSFDRGAWSSDASFTVNRIEGQTQFSSDLSETLGWDHTLRNQPHVPLTVEADVSGMPARFMRTQETRWDEDSRGFVPVAQANIDETAGTVRPDQGAGLGIDGDIPTDRIKRAWLGDTEISTDELRQLVDGFAAGTINPKESPADILAALRGERQAAPYVKDDLEKAWEAYVANPGDETGQAIARARMARDKSEADRIREELDALDAIGLRRAGEAARDAGESYRQRLIDAELVKRGLTATPEKPAEQVEPTGTVRVMPNGSRQYEITAPDGSIIKFASERNSYSHAVISKDASGKWSLNTRHGDLAKAQSELSRVRGRGVKSDMRIVALQTAATPAAADVPEVSPQRQQVLDNLPSYSPLPTREQAQDAASTRRRLVAEMDRYVDPDTGYVGRDWHPGAAEDSAFEDVQERAVEYGITESNGFTAQEIDDWIEVQVLSDYQSVMDSHGFGADGKPYDHNPDLVPFADRKAPAVDAVPDAPAPESAPVAPRQSRRERARQDLLDAGYDEGALLDDLSDDGADKSDRSIAAARLSLLVEDPAEAARLRKLAADEAFDWLDENGYSRSDELPRDVRRTLEDAGAPLPGKQAGRRVDTLTGDSDADVLPDSAIDVPDEPAVVRDPGPDAVTLDPAEVAADLDSIATPPPPPPARPLATEFGPIETSLPEDVLPGDIIDLPYGKLRGGRVDQVTRNDDDGTVTLSGWWYNPDSKAEERFSSPLRTGGNSPGSLVNRRRPTAPQPAGTPAAPDAAVTPDVPEQPSLADEFGLANMADAPDPDSMDSLTIARERTRLTRIAASLDNRPDGADLAAQVRERLDALTAEDRIRAKEEKKGVVRLPDGWKISGLNMEDGEGTILAPGGEPVGELTAFMSTGGMRWRPQPAGTTKRWALDYDSPEKAARALRTFLDRRAEAQRAAAPPPPQVVAPAASPDVPTADLPKGVAAAPSAGEGMLRGTAKALGISTGDRIEANHHGFTITGTAKVDRGGVTLTDDQGKDFWLGGTATKLTARKLDASPEVDTTPEVPADATPDTTAPSAPGTPDTVDLTPEQVRQDLADAGIDVPETIDAPSAEEVREQSDPTPDTPQQAASETSLAPDDAVTLGEVDPAEDLDPEPQALPGEKFPPSRQQQAVFDAVQQIIEAGSGRVKVQAGAGAGKTSTLEALSRRVAEWNPNAKVGYVAFNTSVADEARGRMPANTEPRTGHALGVAFAGQLWKDRGLKGLSNDGDLARHYSVTKDLTSGPKWDVREQVKAANEAVTAFSNSADDTISTEHFKGALDEMTPADRGQMMALAGRMWADLTSKTGKQKVVFDHARKMWALSKPDFSKNGWAGRKVDVLYIDEAQDTPPVLAKVVEDQTIPVVIVGDQDQAIYGFTGAIDFLDKVDADAELPLTKSYRFGPQVAAVGNRFLTMLGSRKRIEGGGPASEVLPAHTMTGADAILTRSNGGMIGEIVREQEDGRLVGLTKGTKADLLNLVATVRHLQGTGGKPYKLHEDLEGYDTWSQITQDVDEGKANAKVSMLVRMIRDHGTDGLEGIIEQTVDQSEQGLDGVLIDRADRGMVLGGNTFPLQKRLSDRGLSIGRAGFRWQVKPGGGVNRKGEPVKEWVATGTPEQQDAALARLRELDGGDSRKPDVTVSTAHKAKGLEWDRVRVGGDFRGPETDPETGETTMPSAEELRLAYVTVTRAQKELDPGSLSWVYDHTDDADGDPVIRDRADAPTIDAPETDAPANAPEVVTGDIADVREDLIDAGVPEPNLPEPTPRANDATDGDRADAPAMPGDGDAPGDADAPSPDRDRDRDDADAETVDDPDEIDLPDLDENDPDISNTERARRRDENNRRRGGRRRRRDRDGLGGPDGNGGGMPGGLPDGLPGGPSNDDPTEDAGRRRRDQDGNDRDRERERQDETPADAPLVAAPVGESPVDDATLDAQAEAILADTPQAIGDSDELQDEARIAAGGAAYRDAAPGTAGAMRPGDVIEDGGKRWTVDSVRPSSGGQVRAVLHPEGQAGVPIGRVVVWPKDKPVNERPWNPADEPATAESAPSRHKPTPIGRAEANIAAETQRDDGNDAGFTIDGDEVVVHDPNAALWTLEGPRDIAADNLADGGYFGTQGRVDQNRDRARRDGLSKLMDSIRAAHPDATPTPTGQPERPAADSPSPAAAGAEDGGFLAEQAAGARAYGLPDLAEHFDDDSAAPLALAADAEASVGAYVAQNDLSRALAAAERGALIDGLDPALAAQFAQSADRLRDALDARRKADQDAIPAPDETGRDETVAAANAARARDSKMRPGARGKQALLSGTVSGAAGDRSRQLANALQAAVRSDSPRWVIPTRSGYQVVATDHSGVDRLRVQPDGSVYEVPASSYGPDDTRLGDVRVPDADVARALDAHLKPAATQAPTEPKTAADLTPGEGWTARPDGRGHTLGVPGEFDAEIVPQGAGYRWTLTSPNGASEGGMAATQADARRELDQARRAWKQGGLANTDLPGDTTPAEQPEPVVDPEPIGGRGAEWVQIVDLQPGDTARVAGVDSDGVEHTRAGYVIGAPLPVTADTTPAVAVVLGDSKDGLTGDRGMLVTATDALVTRVGNGSIADPESDQAALSKPDLDVREGRLAERMPLDTTGVGIFPGSIVEARTGADGIVMATTDDQVLVRWPGGADEQVRGETLTVTDGGVRRPAGWSSDGRKITAGQIVSTPDGNGTVASVDPVDPDRVTVALGDGSEFRGNGAALRVLSDSPADAAAATVPDAAPEPIAVRPVEPLPVAPLPAESLTPALSDEQLRAVLDLGHDLDHVSGPEAAEGTARLRDGLPLSPEQAEALAGEARRVAGAGKSPDRARNHALLAAADALEGAPTGGQPEDPQALTDRIVTPHVQGRSRATAEAIAVQAADAALGAESIHELRENVAQALTPQAVLGEKQRVAEQFYDDVTRAGQQGPDRTRALDAGDQAADEAIDRVRQAALGTINDAEPLDGETPEQTADRVASMLLRTADQPVEPRAEQQTLFDDDDTAADRPDAPDAPAVEPELPNREARRAKAVEQAKQQVADHLATDLEALANELTATAPAGRTLTDAEVEQLVEQALRSARAAHPRTARRITRSLSAGRPARPGLLASVLRLLGRLLARLARTLGRALRADTDAVRAIRTWKATVEQDMPGWDEHRRLAALADQAVPDNLPAQADELFDTAPAQTVAGQVLDDLTDSRNG